MKKLFSAILMILFAASIASASYLTCDPQDAVEVTMYKIELNGEVIPAEIENVGERQVRLIYNVDHLTSGGYRVIAAAGNERGEWSGWSEEFKFHIGISTPESLCISYVFKEVGRISQEGWSVYYVSSEETENKGFLAANAFDGDSQTQWNSSWLPSGPSTSHPHEIQIDMGKENRVQGLYYLSRQDINWNGTIESFILYVSVDGKDWTEVASGNFAKTKEEQLVEFAPVSARYVSLVSLSEVNGKEWTTVAEINILGVE